MNEMIKKKDVIFFESLCRKYSIAAFILFGSLTSGRAGAMSDVDIAYLPSRKLSHGEEDGLYLETIKQLNRDDVDLVDASKADLLLKYSIIASGKVIACIDEKMFYDFIIATRRDYLDTVHLRSIFAKYLVGRIKLGLFGRAQ